MERHRCPVGDRPPDRHLGRDGEGGDRGSHHRKRAGHGGHDRGGLRRGPSGFLLGVGGHACQGGRGQVWAEEFPNYDAMYGLDLVIDHDLVCFWGDIKSQERKTTAYLSLADGSLVWERHFADVI